MWGRTTAPHQDLLPTKWRKASSFDKIVSAQLSFENYKAATLNHEIKEFIPEL